MSQFSPGGATAAPEPAPTGAGGARQNRMLLALGAGGAAAVLGVGAWFLFLGGSEEEPILDDLASSSASDGIDVTDPVTPEPVPTPAPTPEVLNQGAVARDPFVPLIAEPVAATSTTTPTGTATPTAGATTTPTTGTTPFPGTTATFEVNPDPQDSATPDPPVGSRLKPTGAASTLGKKPYPTDGATL